MPCLYLRTLLCSRLSIRACSPLYRACYLMSILSTSMAKALLMRKTSRSNACLSSKSSRPSWPVSASQLPNRSPLTLDKPHLQLSPPCPAPSQSTVRRTALSWVSMPSCTQKSSRSQLARTRRTGARASSRRNMQGMTTWMFKA